MKQRNNEPIAPKVPLFAPEGSVPLSTMLDEIGKAVEPAWTGEEVAAEPVIERSDADLEMAAFQDFMREGETRSEAEILAETRQRYEQETAPRRRRQAVVYQCRELLHRGLLPSIAFGSNGKIYEIPSHIWAANGAEELFDTGGILLVSGKKVTFQRGLTQGDNTAIVLVKAVDLNDVVKRLSAGECLATAAPQVGRTETSSSETGRSGYPGRPSVRNLVEAELRRRAAAGECRGSLREEAEDLFAWVKQAHPDAPHPTPKTIENQIRHLRRMLVGTPPTK